MSECLKEKTILFVDDEEGIRKVMKAILEPRCQEVFIADNGKTGLEMYKEKLPDIVITDIEMPVMNGLKLLEEIKAIDKEKPVVIVTAFKDEAHKAEQADEVLVKPVKKAFLVETLAKYC